MCLLSLPGAHLIAVGLCLHEWRARDGGVGYHQAVHSQAEGQRRDVGLLRSGQVGRHLTRIVEGTASVACIVGFRDRV